MSYKQIPTMLQSPSTIAQIAAIIVVLLTSTIISAESTTNSIDQEPTTLTTTPTTTEGVTTTLTTTATSSATTSQTTSLTTTQTTTARTITTPQLIQSDAITTPKPVSTTVKQTEPSTTTPAITTPKTSTPQQTTTSVDYGILGVYGKYGIGPHAITTATKSNSFGSILFRYNATKVGSNRQPFAKGMDVESSCGLSAVQVIITDAQANDHVQILSLLVSPGGSFAINGTLPFPSQLRVLMKPVGVGFEACSDALVVLDASCESPFLIGDWFGSLEIVGFFQGDTRVQHCPGPTAAVNSDVAIADPLICNLPSSLLPSCDACNHNLNGGVSKLQLRHLHMNQNNATDRNKPQHVIGHERISDPDYVEVVSRIPPDSQDPRFFHNSPLRVIVYTGVTVLYNLANVLSGDETLIIVPPSSESISIAVVDVSMAGCMLHDESRFSVAIIAAHPNCLVESVSIPTLCSKGVSVSVGDSFGRVVEVVGIETRATPIRLPTSSIDCPCAETSSAFVCGPQSGKKLAHITLRYNGDVCTDTFGKHLHVCNQQYSLASNFSHTSGVPQDGPVTIHAQRSAIDRFATFHNMARGDTITIQNIGYDLLLMVVHENFVSSTVAFRTSCDAPIYIRDRYGGFEVIAAETTSIYGSDDDDVESTTLEVAVVTMPEGVYDHRTKSSGFWEQKSTIPIMIVLAVVAIVAIGCLVRIRAHNRQTVLSNEYSSADAWEHPDKNNNSSSVRSGSSQNVIPHPRNNFQHSQGNAHPHPQMQHEYATPIVNSMRSGLGGGRLLSHISEARTEEALHTKDEDDGYEEFNRVSFDSSAIPRTQRAGGGGQNLDNVERTENDATPVEPLPKSQRFPKATRYTATKSNQKRSSSRQSHNSISSEDIGRLPYDMAGNKTMQSIALSSVGDGWEYDDTTVPFHNNHIGDSTMVVHTVGDGIRQPLYRQERKKNKRETEIQRERNKRETPTHKSIALSSVQGSVAYDVPADQIRFKNEVSYAPLPYKNEMIYSPLTHKSIALSSVPGSTIYDVDNRVLAPHMNSFDGMTHRSIALSSVNDGASSSGSGYESIVPNSLYNPDAYRQHGTVSFPAAQLMVGVSQNQPTFLQTQMDAALRYRDQRGQSKQQQQEANQRMQQQLQMQHQEQHQHQHTHESDQQSIHEQLEQRQVTQRQPPHYAPHHRGNVNINLQPALQKVHSQSPHQPPHHRGNVNINLQPALQKVHSRVNSQPNKPRTKSTGSSFASRHLWGPKRPHLKKIHGTIGNRSIRDDDSANGI